MNFGYLHLYHGGVMKMACFNNFTKYDTFSNNLLMTCNNGVIEAWLDSSTCEKNCHRNGFWYMKPDHGFPGKVLTDEEMWDINEREEKKSTKTYTTTPKFPREYEYVKFPERDGSRIKYYNEQFWTSGADMLHSEKFEWPCEV